MWRASGSSGRLRELLVRIVNPAEKSSKMVLGSAYRNVFSRNTRCNLKAATARENPASSPQAYIYCNRNPIYVFLF
jgi:hypothetical protein